MSNYNPYVDDLPEDDPSGTQPVGTTPPRPIPPARSQETGPSRPVSGRTAPIRPVHDADRVVRQSQPMRQPPQAPPVMPPDQMRLPQTPARRRPPPVDKRSSGLYLPWWSLVVMLIFVGAAAIGAWAVVDTLGGNVAPGGSTPIVIVVTATPTAGPPPTFTPLPAIVPLASPALPTIAPTPTLPPGDFRVGAIVEVVGVGLTGLNVRSGPGLSAAVRFIAPEKARFVLKAGPQAASGVEWWELQDPNDLTRTGWASRQFLTVVSQ